MAVSSRQRLGCLRFRRRSKLLDHHNTCRSAVRGCLAALLIQSCIMSSPADADSPRITIRYDGDKLAELCGDLLQSPNNGDFCGGYIVGFMQANGMLSRRSQPFIACAFHMHRNIFSDFKNRWASKRASQNFTYALTRSIERTCSNPDGEK